MALSDFSIRKPVFAWMLMLGLIIFGAVGFTRMGLSQLPDADFPVVTVSLTYEGAAPEVMETDIVDVVEGAVMSVEGVRSVTSYSKYGSATVSVEFELSRSIDAALQEIQTKVAQAQRNLPKEIDPPIITKTNPDDQPILWLSLSSDRMELKELMRYTRDQLKDKFSTISGVGEVVLGGYVEPNLRVWVNNKDLDRYNFTVTDVLNTIQSEHSELPAGQIETAAKESNVRTMGEARSPEEFGSIVINQRGGQPNYTKIRLNQVAKIEEGLADVRRKSRFMGKPAVGLGIRKQRGSNAVAVAHGVKSRMEEVRKVLPPGTSLDINFDTTRFIEDSVDELNLTLILSALLTAFVCWLFLGSWSSTFNVLMAIPTSIVGAFLILYFFGFTLNTFTLLGLSLAIGIVVDDAIMVLENIVRHREMGKDRVQAALEGSRQITPAAVAATIAIVAIFLPVAFMRGVIGKFFFQFGVTMTATVLLSLLEALTLTPMRCAQFVEVSHRTTKFGKWVDRTFERLQDWYQKTLSKVLHHRAAVIIATFIFFGASVSTVKFLGKEFVPPQDMGVFLITLKTSVDASINYTDEKFKKLEEFLKSHPDIVDHYYVAVGGFGGDVNSGAAFVTLKNPGHRKRNPLTGREYTQFDFMDVCRKELSKIPDVKVFIQDLSMRGFSASRGFPVEFSVRGPDWDKLGTYSTQIMEKMRSSGLMTDVDTDYLLGKPEVRIYPDRSKAAKYAVSIQAISQTINGLIGGVTSGKYPMGGHRYDIRVRLLPVERETKEQIKHLFVRNNRGEVIPLSELVTIEEKPSLQQITRYDRERAITVFANVKAGQSQARAIEEVQKIGKEILPVDYHVVMSGSAKTFKESFDDLIIALVMGVLVAYMVLGSQFNSFIDPVTVLLALPFSVSGAFLALFLSHQSLNIYSFIGLILLMGIVKKNSILLVDFTNQTREAGITDVREALVKACPTRLRPILMTSIATIAGAIPQALAIGPGAEARMPMAIAVIGGVLVSTLLTLVVVPCAYSVFAQLKASSRRHRSSESLAPGAST